MRELLSELFDRYYKDVYVYVYSLCHDTSLSEDLTSEVFLEVVRSIATFRRESDIKTWLFSIARHKWYAYLRSKSKEVKTMSIDDLYESSLVKSSTQENIGGLEDVIQSLVSSESKITQEVFQMRLEGYSYYEIGNKLGISESSARVVYFRIKNKIKKYLEKEGF
ncbi:MAG: RNA polymerase sigma factor [Erysipelotrichaceae bacterium]|nr:RNA polymerase sigma factor [Erysipelotrichaceae bacterium]